MALEAVSQQKKPELTTHPVRERSAKRPKLRLWVHLGLMVSCFLVSIPMLFAIIKSTQSQAQVQEYPPNFLPGSNIIENYQAALVNYKLATYMFNSTLVAVIVMVGKVFLSFMAAAAFVYFRFPLKGLLFALVLATILMPTEIIIIGLNNIINTLDWRNNYLALTVPFLASATGVFLFRQHFSNIPSELADAAQIDGAGPIGFLWYVLVPNSWNVIGALALIQFVYMWNQFIWPLYVIDDQERQMIQVGLSTFITSDAAKIWGQVMAGAVLASLPPLILFLLLQNQFIRSFSLSRDK